MLKRGESIKKHASDERICQISGSKTYNTMNNNDQIENLRIFLVKISSTSVYFDNILSFRVKFWIKMESRPVFT